MRRFVWSPSQKQTWIDAKEFCSNNILQKCRVCMIYKKIHKRMWCDKWCCVETKLQCPRRKVILFQITGCPEVFYCPYTVLYFLYSFEWTKMTLCMFYAFILTVNFILNERCGSSHTLRLHKTFLALLELCHRWFDSFIHTPIPQRERIKFRS